MNSDTVVHEHADFNNGEAITAKRTDRSAQKRKLKDGKDVNNDSKISRKELYKLPTVEELNQLRETEILFNSNLFRLQTEELLKEVLLKQKRRREIDAWFEKFKEFLNDLPEHTGITYSDFNACTETATKSKLKGKLKEIAKNVPINLKTDQNSSIKFVKPCAVEIVGLYNVNATIGPVHDVTLNVVIPKHLFHEKDYLNARYIVKRSLYLSYIATYLKSSELASNVSYTYLEGNCLLPILHVIPIGIKNVTINVMLSPEEDTFKLSRFDDGKSNVRCAFFNNSLGESLSGGDGEPWPTPFYNSVVLGDVQRAALERFRRGQVQGLAGACAALALLAVWLRQRQLATGFGGLGADLQYALVAHLVHTGKVNRHMSSYQVVRNVWNHLAHSNWLVDETVVFPDQSGRNLTAGVDPHVYLRVKHEATLALGYLNESNFNSFTALFMTKMPFYSQYDAVINIFNSSKLKDVYNKVDEKQKLDHLGFRYPLILRHLIGELKNGLTDRVLAVVPQLQASVVWVVGASPPEDALFASVGLQLDVAHMYKVVDKGPPAYDPLAARFREFWGERAELRRFKDGSIFEAVYWPTETVQDKRTIAKKVVQFVLEEKLKLKKFSVCYDQFDEVLQVYKSPAVEEGNLKVVTTFDDLAKMLRDLNLPLSISSVQGTSDAFCHSDPFPPTPSNYKSGNKVTRETANNIVFKDDVDVKVAPRYVKPAEGIIQMVNHSKWPSEARAMDNLRTAFYLQMSEQLVARGVRCLARRHHLDVLHQGLLFRLELYHPKQLALARRPEGGDPVLAAELERRCAVAPRLAGALGGVHARWPSYGPAAALARRWLAAQLLDEALIPRAAAALLTASLYVHSAPHEPPALPQAAFVRFLALLARLHAQTQLCVVNFNGELTKEQLDVAEAGFQQHRDEYPPLTIITPHDCKSLVTQHAPSREILHRLSVLASQCLAAIEKDIYSHILFNVLGLFKPNLSGYNVLIHLQPLLNPRRLEAIGSHGDASEFDEKVKDKMPIVDFNPVELYLSDLRQHYDDLALFFHDSYGGSVIAVLWKPCVSQEHDFKITQVGGKRLSEDKLQVNVDAITEDFYILGDGLVKTIEQL